MDGNILTRPTDDNEETTERAEGGGWSALWQWADFIRKRVGSATNKIAGAFLKFVNTKSGEAWPSIATIAREAGVSPRTAQRGMADLEVLGFVIVVRQATHHSTKRWRISFGRGDTSDVSKVTRQKRRPTKAHSGVTVLTPRGDSSDVQGRQFCHPELKKELPKEPKKKTRAKARDGLPDGFDEFWEIYAHKIDRKKAVAAWRKALKLSSAGEIIAAAKRYASTRNPNFIAHASTWLNGERWNDEPQTHTGLNHDEHRNAARQGQPVTNSTSARAGFARALGLLDEPRESVASGPASHPGGDCDGLLLEGRIEGRT